MTTKIFAIQALTSRFNIARIAGSSEGYPSGQRGQTVNLLAYAFGGSNPPPSTSFTQSMRLGEDCSKPRALPANGAVPKQVSPARE